MRIISPLRHLWIGSVCLLLTACSLSAQGNVPISGTIEADELPVTAEVGGMVKTLLVEEGATVKKGELLAVLDDQAYQLALKEAQAVLAQATARLEEAKAGARDQTIRQAAAAVQQADANTTLAVAREGQASANLARAYEQWKQAEAELDGAKRTLAYQQSRLQEVTALYQSGGVSKRDYEAQQEAVNQAQTQVNRLTAQWEAYRSQYESAKKDLEAAYAQREAMRAQAKSAQAQLDLLQAGSTDYTIKELLAAQQQAMAKVEQAQLQVTKAKIVAPQDGIVLRKDVLEGEVVKPGAVLFTLMKRNQLQCKTYIPEADLGRVKVGQRVQVRVDAYPNETFSGRIASIANHAEFTPRNLQTRDERTKLVFQVTIRFDSGFDKLKPGMPADIWLNGEVAGQ